MRTWALLGIVGVSACATTPPVFVEKTAFYAEYLRFRQDGVCEPTLKRLSGDESRELQECFASPKTRVQAAYRYDKGVWILRVEETTPTCLVELLPEINVPSEIVFLAPAPERSTPECYAAGVQERKMDLVLTLPREDLPSEPRGLERVLVAWALSGFFDEGRIQAKRVPRRTCSACFGDPRIFDPEWLRNHPTRLWP